MSPGRRPGRRKLPLLAFLAAAFLGFIALGTWQVERRAWKLDLIRRVDARIHSAAVDAPGPAAWLRLAAANDEYRHVRVTGIFQPAASAHVQAVTELGPGFWLITPLVRNDDGSTVFINRGFVGEQARPAVASASDARTGPGIGPDQAAGTSGAAPNRAVTVTGLLRLSEPGGGFLRHNDPAADRWYSRDVAAIAAARRLPGAVAPFFIDAEAAPPGRTPDPGEPVGGLTVVSFHNSHLVYALTWYGLAALAGVGAWQVLRAERG